MSTLLIKKFIKSLKLKPISEVITQSGGILFSFDFKSEIVVFYFLNTKFIWDTMYFCSYSDNPKQVMWNFEELCK